MTDHAATAIHDGAALCAPPIRPTALRLDIGNAFRRWHAPAVRAASRRSVFDRSPPSLWRPECVRRREQFGKTVLPAVHDRAKDGLLGRRSRRAGSPAPPASELQHRTSRNLQRGHECLTRPSRICDSQDVVAASTFTVVVLASRLVDEANGLAAHWSSNPRAPHEHRPAAVRGRDRERRCRWNEAHSGLSDPAFRKHCRNRRLGGSAPALDSIFPMRAASAPAPREKIPT